MPFLAAHVSSRMRFTDKHQKIFFQSPESIEAEFKRYRKENIAAEYFAELNAFLAEIHTFCTEFNSGAKNEFYKYSDVLMVSILINVDLETRKFSIVLKCIISRPCFSGNSMLTIVTFLLLRAACARKDVVYVVVRQCVDATVRILKHKFGDLVATSELETSDCEDCDDSIDTAPDCVFTDFDRVEREVSVESLGLADKVSIAPDGTPTLNPKTFPTAEQLNDPAWVENNTKIYIDPALALADKAVEDLFAAERGRRISENYIANQINPMLKSMHEYLQNPGDEVFEHTTDVTYIVMGMENYKKNPNVHYIEVSEIAERPCFAGFDMITLIILQLLSVAWARRNVAEILLYGTNESQSSAIQRNFEHASVDDSGDGYVCELNIRYFFDASCVSGLLSRLSPKIKSNQDGLLQLNGNGFPTAAELNETLGIASDPAVLRACIDTNIEYYKDLLFRS